MSQPPTAFHTFFRDRTQTGEPYGYQCRLACGPSASPDSPESLLSGTTCQSQLISIPTGLGKNRQALALLTISIPFCHHHRTKP